MFPIVFFDGVCNLCNGTVNFLIRHDKKALIKFASFNSAVANEYLKGAVIHPLPDSFLFEWPGVVVAANVRRKARIHPEGQQLFVARGCGAGAGIARPAKPLPLEAAS